MHATSFSALRHPCGMDATDTDTARVALPIPSNIVLSSQFPVPCSFNPVRNRNRNPTQRTYNLSASNGNQTVTGRVSEKGDERERERVPRQQQ